MKNLLYLLFAAGSILYLGSCDECRKVECDNGGTCVEGTCDCPEGFSGSSCQNEDLCITQNVVCENGGECVSGECDCTTFFYGESCEDYCQYGSYDNGNCNCNQGIEGESCNIFSRNKFIGTYTFNSAFNTQTMTSIISAGEFENGDVWKVEITNLSSQGDTDGYAIIDGDEISIPEQTVNGQGGAKFTIFSTAPGVWENDGSKITFTIPVSRKLNMQGTTAQTGNYVYSRPAI